MRAVEVEQWGEGVSRNAVTADAVDGGGGDDAGGVDGDDDDDGGDDAGDVGDVLFVFLTPV